MHMSDALLSPIVSTAMSALSVGSMAYSVKNINKFDLNEKKIPLMGVMGAFVFASQMINFTIPITGSSGHIGGGILLAAILGEFPGFLTLASILIIQALFFADGGLLALGCNIFNMGVIPCLIIYPLIFKPLIKNGINKKSLSVASISSAVLGLQLGAFCVVLETLLSGVTKLPFLTFLSLMQPIHLAIGIVEGIITAAILNFVYIARPEILESSYSQEKMQAVSVKKLIISLGIAAALIGGIFSVYASKYPDGLEWSIYKTTGDEEIESSYDSHGAAEKIQSSTAIMPDYDYKNAKGNGTRVAAIVGGVMTFVLAGASGLIITKYKKSRANNHKSEYNNSYGN